MYYLCTLKYYLLLLIINFYFTFHLELEMRIKGTRTRKVDRKRIAIAHRKWNDLVISNGNGTGLKRSMCTYYMFMIV